jgi:hypothetical protein
VTPQCAPGACRLRSLRSDQDNPKYLEIKLLCGKRFDDLSALSHSQVSRATRHPRDLTRRPSCRGGLGLGVCHRAPPNE